MKHEDFRIRYNEIMFDERDMIKSFLERVADISYGNQMYEWNIYNVQVVAFNGALYRCYEIFLENGDVRFRVKQATDPEGADYEVWECSDFALGELSKIIDALPDADDVIMKKAESDMRRLFDKCTDNVISLEDNPFTWKDGKSTFYLHGIDESIGTGALTYEIREDIDGVPGCENNWGLWESLAPDVARNLVGFIKTKFLRESDEYKRLTKQLNWFDGGIYNVVEHGKIGQVCITPDGTDLNLDIIDVRMKKGSLEILVSTLDTRLSISDCNNSMTLYERDLTPENLRNIVNFFDGEDNRHILSLNEEQMDAVEDIRKAFRKASELGIEFISSDETDNMYAFPAGKVCHILNEYDFPWSDELNRKMTEEEQKEYIHFDIKGLEPVNDGSLDVGFGGWSTSEWYGKVIK